jgi:uncharacterized protein YegL
VTKHLVEMTDEEYDAWLRGQPEGAELEDTPSVHVTFLLDRSGSMASMHGDVVGGFNTFVEDQKAQPGACRLTLAQFDSQGYDVIHDAVALGEVPPMRPEDFKPRGGTPLLDAIGRAIASTTVRAERNPPENQLVVILTDGQENQSREYTRAAIKALIAVKEAQGWTFAYLGCDANSYAEAMSFGIRAGSTQTYAGDGAGMAVAFNSLSSNVSHHRGSVARGVAPDPANFYVDRSAEEDAKERGKATKK